MQRFQRLIRAQSGGFGPASKANFFPAKIWPCFQNRTAVKDSETGQGCATASTVTGKINFKTINLTVTGDGKGFDP
jgi:hypothetical protein